MKPSKRAEVNNFIQGLISEASPLNFPPNASKDEENYELNRDGTRDRRLGMGYETGYTLRNIPTASADIKTTVTSRYRWLNANGVPGTEYLVVQFGRHLLFFDATDSIISTDGYLGTIELTSLPSNVVFSYASVEGLLIVAGGSELIAQVSYDGTTFSFETSSLQIRDQWGVEVTGVPQYETDVLYRGASDAKHYYNLQNQSWGIPRKNSAGTLVDPVSQYNTDLSKYPSNSETVWTGLQFQPVTAGSTFERIYTNLYDETFGGDVKAPKGYYIIDALRRGQARMDAFAANYARFSATLATPTVTLPLDYTTGGATVVAEYAGRVWYSGFNGEVTDGDARSPNLTNYILFSKLIKSKSDFYKCYQEGDPTSRDNQDVIDTDGGFVRISGMGSVIGMATLKTSLIVIADNGVWSIDGGSDYGFTPTNYKVNKLSTFGGISFRSIVAAGERIFYWSDTGIYVIAKNQYGDLEVSNLTEATIQTFYEEIPNTSKLNTKGQYDPVSKKIRWLYKTGSLFGSDSVTKELILDLVINAFYVNRIMKLDTNDVETIDLFQSSSFNRGEQLSLVFVGEDLVEVSTDPVVVSEDIREAGNQSTRYIVLQNVAGVIKFTFAYYNNVDFIDWIDVDSVGKDAFAFLLTGDQTVGDSAISKQIPYLVMFFRRTENGVTSDLVPNYQSGCLMRCQWDFSNTANSKKWSDLVQTYRYRRARYVEGLDDEYDTGFAVISSKSKVRGRGKTFALYLCTEPLKDCRIVGWSITVNGNPNA